MSQFTVYEQVEFTVFLSFLQPMGYSMGHVGPEGTDTGCVFMLIIYCICGILISNYKDQGQRVLSIFPFGNGVTCLFLECLKIFPVVGGRETAFGPTDKLISLFLSL